MKNDILVPLTFKELVFEKGTLVTTAKLNLEGEPAICQCCKMSMMQNDNDAKCQCLQMPILKIESVPQLYLPYPNGRLREIDTLCYRT